MPLSSIDPSGGIPVDLTSFVGRRAERQQIRSLLAAARLVTLTGFGGIGKTRLATRVGTDLRRAYPDGVVFASLASITDPTEVAATIGGALGLEGRTTQAPIAALVEFLTPRSALLVLDNCEHVIDGAAICVDTLLRTCPQLRILATSREPLRIDGETVHAVEPLSIPPRGASEPLEQFESVNLLIERARTHQPGFNLDDAGRDAIATISRRLEGIPLAIELAAARLRTMTAPELVQNLNDAWEMLNRGSRTAPERQRTMRNCIQWSHGLCSPEEQRLWADLSVFGDGFERDAVRGVCADVPEVDDVLTSLVEKSLVVVSESHGRTRFRLLPPLRQHGAAELIAQDRQSEMRRRHRDWHVDLVLRIHADWLTDRQLEGLDRLRRELGNLQASLEACVDYPETAEAGLLMGAHVLEYGLADGLFRQGRMWFDRLLQIYREPTPIRALALRVACWWAAMQGDLDAATELLEEAREAAIGHDAHTRALIDQATAFVSMFLGDTESAAVQFEAAIAALEAVGDRTQIAHSWSLAALNHVFRGDPEQALAAHERCLAITVPTGEVWFTSYSLWIAGLATWLSGDVAGAADLERRSLELKRSTRDQLGIATSIEALGYFSADDDPERAAVLLGAAQAIWERIDTSTSVLGGLRAMREAALAKLGGVLGPRLPPLFEQGRASSPAEAIDIALHPTAARDTIPAPGGTHQAAQAAPAHGTPAASPASILTRRQREIAGLVADGMSNQDIADALVISKRTAETHVEHILTKLGFNNRSQIAAWYRALP